MRNIAFFVDNSKIASIDTSCVEHGNPGIGGTEYLIILVSSMLAKTSSRLKVTLYGVKPQKMPSSVDYVVVDSFERAIQDAEKNRTDFFVTKHVLENVTTSVLTSHSKMRFIVWCHVFACYWELDAYARNKYVDKVVFVGREMMDLYRDHVIMKKATYIYNCVSLDNTRELVKEHPFENRKHVVPYVGSIVPFKGFHLLAQAWPEILHEIPDAELYVIGSGTVYNDKAKIGKYGIAEERYENLISQYLYRDGTLLSGVHFMGRMGKEKDEILLKTKVGVPNPSGITETFCLSAVEMQALGARIATIKAPGYMDTVKNGCMYTDPKMLARTVIEELRGTETKYDDLLYGDWHQDVSMINLTYRLKWLKDCIRKISRIIPINKILPPVERCLILYERRIRRRTTFMDSDIKI